MWTAERIAHALLESNPVKGRAVAFGPGLPEHGFLATTHTISDFLVERGVARDRADVLKRFTIFFVNNNVELALAGNPKNRFSQDQLKTLEFALGFEGVENVYGPNNTIIPVASLFVDKKTAKPTKVKGPYTGIQFDLTALPPKIVSVAGPAYRANLRPGDQITHVAGENVAEEGALVDALNKLKSSRPAELVVRRRGTPYRTRLIPA